MLQSQGSCVTTPEARTIVKKLMSLRTAEEVEEFTSRDDASWVTASANAGGEAHQHKDRNRGLVEIVTNAEEAIVMKDEYNYNVTEARRNITNGSERFGVTAYDGSESNELTYEVYDTGTGMKKQKVIDIHTNVLEIGEEKDKIDEIQGGKGKGSISALGFCDYKVMITSPEEEPEKIVATIVREKDKQIQYLTIRGSILTVKLPNGFEVGDERYLSTSGSIIRLIDYNMADDRNIPKSIAAVNYRRTLGEYITECGPLTLRDERVSGNSTIQEEADFEGSLTIVENNRNAFSCYEEDSITTQINGEKRDLEYVAVVQKEAEEREELYQQGTLNKRHAGESSPNRGTSMKDLFNSQNGVAIQLHSTVTAHHTESPRVLESKCGLDNIATDTKIFLDIEGYEDDLCDSQRSGLREIANSENVMDSLISEIKYNRALTEENKKRGKEYQKQQRKKEKATESKFTTPPKQKGSNNSDWFEELEKEVVTRYNHIVCGSSTDLKQDIATQIAVSLVQRFGETYHKADHIGESHTSPSETELQSILGDIVLIGEDETHSIELKVSKDGGHGTRFNTTPDLFTETNVIRTDTLSIRDHLHIHEFYTHTHEKLREYRYPQTVCDESETDRKNRLNMAKYIRKTINDSKASSVTEIIDNPDKFGDGLVQAAEIKQHIMGLAGTQIRSYLKPLRYREYDTEKLKALTIFLTAGIHTMDELKTCMEKYTEEELGITDITEAYSDGYTLMYADISEDEGSANSAVDCSFSTPSEAQLYDLANKMLKLNIAPVKSNGDLSKRVEIGFEDDGEFLTVYKAQYNWRNVFQGIDTLSIEGFEGDYFDTV